VDGKTWLESLEPPQGGGQPVEWLDVLVFAEQEHGPRATRWLADEMGVSLRTAQRYMRLDHAPHRRGPAGAARHLMADVGRRMADESEAQRRDDTADLIRLIRTITPGVVWVRPKSSSKGRPTKRTIKQLSGVDLGAVADAWADDDPDEADAALSDAIIDAYGQLSNTPNLAEYLQIVDYETGLDYT